MSEIAQPQPETIKLLADKVRRTLIANFGEAYFARLCLEFDHLISGDFPLKSFCPE
jgi:hypothetical protein